MYEVTYEVSEAFLLDEDLRHLAAARYFHYSHHVVSIYPRAFLSSIVLLVSASSLVVKNERIYHRRERERERERDPRVVRHPTPSRARSRDARVALYRNQKSTPSVDRAVLRDTTGNERQIKHDIYNKLAITSSPPTFSSAGPIMLARCCGYLYGSSPYADNGFPSDRIDMPRTFPCATPWSVASPPHRQDSRGRAEAISRDRQKEIQVRREVGAAIKGASLKGASLYAAGTVCGEVCARIFRDSHAHFSRGKFKGLESRSSSSPSFRGRKIRDVRLSRAEKWPRGGHPPTRLARSRERLRSCPRTIHAPVT